MSVHNVTCHLPEEQRPPVYLTALPAANLVGITRATLTKYLAPDAWYESAAGTKSYPLWLRETVERYCDERQAAEL